MSNSKRNEVFDSGYPVNLMQLLLNYYDWFDASLQRVLESSGDKAFSKAQSVIFVNLAEGRNTAVDIARHIGVSKQAVNKTVNELVERGFLTLVTDSEDKRSKRILPTRAGLEKGRQAAKALHELEQELARRIGKERADTLREILEQSPGPVFDTK